MNPTRPMTKKPGPGRLRIVSLTAENIKRIVAVHIEPDGSLVQITGKNGHGKSSVLDSIWWALQGKGVVQAQPIRNGQDAGMIRIDFGSVIVTRHFQRVDETEYTTSLVVENNEGAIYSSPQRMLDGFLGSLSFDPLAFVEADPKTQFARLGQLVNLDVDLDEIDRLNKGDYERRTQVNRTVLHLKEKVRALAADLRDGDDSAIDTAALLSEMQLAAETNDRIRRMQDEQTRTRERLAAQGERARSLQIEADGLEKRAQELRAEADRLIAATAKEAVAPAEAIPPFVDVSSVRAKVEEATTENNRRLASRNARTNHATAVKDHLAAQEEADALTGQMEGREAAKVAAIAAAKMPVGGLSFGEGVVTYRGVPLDQASTAEQIRVSLAICGAMNQDLRVILIRQGSLLDPESMDIVARWAEENGYQVWMERVDVSGKVGIVMEDGQARVAG